MNYGPTFVYITRLSENAQEATERMDSGSGPPSLVRIIVNTHPHTT